MSTPSVEYARNRQGADDLGTEIAAEDRATRATVGGAALRWMLVIAAYVAAATLMTWPLVIRLGTDTLPGISGDQSQYMWNVDTFWMNVRAGWNPFYTSRVMFPIGANLMHTGYAPFVSLFAWPFL